jgi:hypothetical protein
MHALAAAAVTLLVGLLLLGWRDREQIDIGDQLAALLSMFAGILFGVLWALLLFCLDWTLQTDFQNSNTDTMTGLLGSDVGAVAAGVAAVRVYCRLIPARQRLALAEAGAWLVNGPSRLLDRHGALVALSVSATAALVVASLWFVGR